jgi:hypothetical protein
MLESASDNQVNFRQGGKSNFETSILRRILLKCIEPIAVPLPLVLHLPQELFK